MFGKKKDNHGEHFFLGDLEQDRSFPAEENKTPSSVTGADAPKNAAPQRPRPKPLANPEAMPKPKPKEEKAEGKQEQKREKTVLKSLANPEAMPGPKTVVTEPQSEKKVPAAPKTAENNTPKSVKKTPLVTAVKKYAITRKKDDTKKRPVSTEKGSVKPSDGTSAQPVSVKKDARENLVINSLDGMYDVYEDSKKAPLKPLKKADIIRYAVLFVCIFGFLSAGVFVFGKLYDYYRSYVVYSGLQDLVSEKDFFHEEYLKKSESSIITLTPQDILNGKKEEQSGGSETFSEEQQNLVNKIGQLKKINPDTVGWITIEGTVVNYPVVWSETKNYYLKRDFYGKVLSGGTIYIDERNSSNIADNRNTVIYGHNMTDGSMFASIHDFASASVFYDATIEIATEEGIFVYKPFSAHESNAYDNYFETEFVSDDDFINFCEQMAFISIYETDYSFDKNTQIITLSTCANDETTKDDRFAVHAILTKVIR